MKFLQLLGYDQNELARKVGTKCLVNLLFWIFIFRAFCITLDFP